MKIVLIWRELLGRHYYWKQRIKIRYSIESRFIKYIKGYGFLPFARKFGDKYGKKLMDTAKKAGIDAAKTTSKRAIQKTAEAMGDLIGNKIADKITSIGKPKEKEKTKEIEEIYISPEKRQQIIDGLRLFWMQFHCTCLKTLIAKQCIKMEFQKIINFLDTNSDENLPRSIRRKLQC